MRRQAREAVFKYIYSKLFNSNDEGLFDVLVKELSDDDKSFAKALLTAVEKDQEKNLEVISNLAYGYKLERLINVDKCVLLIGLAELDNFPETDVPVVVDEAVGISAKFSTERSTDFVNGILSEYVRSRENG